ncbi:helix-turn-helix domain-containing protein [Endozoicomonas acroporae]|uniref:helix-turn-helix domain-containing protein n=1 Tax=Endozoicomonas acroporae TaxID=1701104 RepID=UPI003D7B828C
MCRRKSAQYMVLRAKIILAGAEGKSLHKTSQDLECNRETVTRWRQHWVERSDDLSVLECLKEAPRPGAIPKFNAEQICQIIAMSCDKPEDHGYPFSHWSENSLSSSMRGWPSHLSGLSKAVLCRCEYAWVLRLGHTSP